MIHQCNAASIAKQLPEKVQNIVPRCIFLLLCRKQRDKQYIIFTMLFGCNYLYTYQPMLKFIGNLNNGCYTSGRTAKNEEQNIVGKLEILLTLSNMCHKRLYIHKSKLQRGISYTITASSLMNMVSLHCWHLQCKTDSQFCRTYDIPLSMAQHCIRQSSFEPELIMMVKCMYIITRTGLCTML